MKYEKYNKIITFHDHLFNIKTVVLTKEQKVNLLLSNLQFLVSHLVKRLVSRPEIIEHIQLKKFSSFAN